MPPGKDVFALDRKLISGYGLELSKWQRARLKAKGRAKLSYLRYERFFILIATQGDHTFYRREGQIRDIRREPVIFQGYSIGCSKGSDGRYHASVKIQSDVFNERLAYLLGLAAHRSAEQLSREFESLNFTPYARVRRQLLRILKEVNACRSMAGFSTVSRNVLKLTRVPKKVFAGSDVEVENYGENASSTDAKMANHHCLELAS